MSASKFTAGEAGGQAVDAAAWLEALHRRCCDRIAHPEIRRLAVAHCRLEIHLAHGWPTFCLAGRMPAAKGMATSSDGISYRYREALQSVLKEMAGKEALEVGIEEPTLQAGLFGEAGK